MPSLRDSAHELRVISRSQADHEEGRACLMPLEDVEKPRGEFGMRPIVKRESSDRIPCRNMRDASHYVPASGCKQFARNPDQIMHLYALSSLRQQMVTQNFSRSRNYAPGVLD